MRCVGSSLFASALALALVAAVGTEAKAAEALGGLGADEIKALSPLLRKNRVVALCETREDGFPRAMTLAIRVNAPREAVFRVFENPENFYYLSSLFKENELQEEHESSKAWSWASRHKLFSFTGINTISLFPPRRVDVAIVKSSVGAGQFRFLFHEDGKDATIIVLSGVLDVQSSEWLIRYLIGNSPAMRQAMNVAIGLVVVMGAKAMAERAASGKPLALHRTKGKRKGPLKPLSEADIRAIGSLLDRGMVVIVSSVRGGRLDQATAVEKVRAPAAKVMGAAASPEYYPQMIRAMTNIVVHERLPDRTEFSWTIGLSVFGLTSRNRLTFAPDGVLVDGLDGDLAGAQWRWQVKPTGPETCVVAYHAWADILKAGYILEKSMRREPYLEHGFLAGSNMVMLRAVRMTVEKK